MKHSSIKINERIEELSFIIAPPPHIRSDVSVLKDDVQFLTGEIFSDRYAPAQIALFKYDDQNHFADIIREVEIKALAFDPFNVFIKNLKCFRHTNGHCIYLDIINKMEIREIFGRLVKQNTHYVPLIPVAAELAGEHLQKAWPHLKDFRYVQDFLCDRITVLGRRGDKWLPFRDIRFGTE